MTLSWQDFSITQEYDYSCSEAWSSEQTDVINNWAAHFNCSLVAHSGVAAFSLTGTGQNKRLYLTSAGGESTSITLQVPTGVIQVKFKRSGSDNNPVIRNVVDGKIILSGGRDGGFVTTYYYSEVSLGYSPYKWHNNDYLLNSADFSTREMEDSEFDKNYKQDGTKLIWKNYRMSKKHRVLASGIPPQDTTTRHYEEFNSINTTSRYFNFINQNEIQFLCDYDRDGSYYWTNNNLYSKDGTLLSQGPYLFIEYTNEWEQQDSTMNYIGDSNYEYAVQLKLNPCDDSIKTYWGANFGEKRNIPNIFPYEWKSSYVTVHRATSSNNVEVWITYKYLDILDHHSTNIFNCQLSDDYYIRMQCLFYSWSEHAPTITWYVDCIYENNHFTYYKRPDDILNNTNLWQQINNNSIQPLLITFNSNNHVYSNNFKFNRWLILSTNNVASYPVGVDSYSYNYYGGYSVSIRLMGLGAGYGGLEDSKNIRTWSPAQFASNTIDGSSVTNTWCYRSNDQPVNYCISKWVSRKTNNGRDYNFTMFASEMPVEMATNYKKRYLVFYCPLINQN